MLGHNWKPGQRIKLGGRKEIMTDEKLIELTARTWVENGGDREGFCYSIEKIKDAISKQEATQ